MSQLRSIRIDGPRSRITIGRANSSHVVLSDPLVSRAHAVVERIGEQWLIRDLGSRNGTYVNGMRVGRATSLRAGDVVQVAETRLQVLSGTSDDSMQTQAPPTVPDARLSARESQVLGLVATGHTDREIAGRLDLSVKTVQKVLFGMSSRRFAVISRTGIAPRPGQRSPSQPPGHSCSSTRWKLPRSGKVVSW